MQKIVENNTRSFEMNRGQFRVRVFVNEKKRVVYARLVDANRFTYGNWEELKDLVAKAKCVEADTWNEHDGACIAADRVILKYLHREIRKNVEKMDKLIRATGSAVSGDMRIRGLVGESQYLLDPEYSQVQGLK
jgi:hypothetical protein